ncbi:replication protein P [Pseudomonas sp. PDM13]|uniref:replication protein P n=1 Tax=Pseudomonas sp. PDM13 TaxID=2769255 RepID=UPI0021E0DFB2|nr:replication protein P [Pseudomonas sp. PDM13]MCU9947523.1 replication protein P [Pseudomonas sp. PDM13]
MNRVDEIAKQVAQHGPSARAAAALKPRTMKVDPATKEVVDQLFVRLKGVFPAWRTAWPDDAAEGASKREWVAEFMRSGIRTLEQIQWGMRIAARQGRDFVPSPGLFVKWCYSPEAFQLPSLELAYAQAVKNTHPGHSEYPIWTHAAVFHAAVETGFYALQRMDREVGLKRFEQKYLEQRMKIARGEVLDPAPVAPLPAPRAPSTPEVGNDALAELRKRIGRKQ